MAAAAETPASPFLAPGFMDDPYPTLAKLRAEDPVHWVPLGFWLILRHDDVKRLFNDPEHATPDRRAWQHFVPRPEGTFMRWVEDNGFFSLPPGEHARLRKLFSVALTPRAVKRYEAQVRETVERFAAPLREASGVVDLMETFANPIPNAVISRITGIPPAGDDERRFRELAQSTIRGFFSFSDEESKRLGEEAFVEIADWVRALAKERRDSLGEDMISDLIRAQDRGDRLSDDQIVMTITGLIGAGSETTSIGGMISAMTLLDHPEQMERLRRAPALIPNAVSEILRFGFGGPGGLPRYAVRDFELRGKQIRKGQMMLLSFGGASRDPAVYEDPDVFDVTRDVRDLITFGNGPHYCLGANLARQEMGCMIEAMLGFLPAGSRWRKDEMAFQTNGLFRRPVTLPIEIPRRASSAGKEKPTGSPARSEPQASGADEQARQGRRNRPVRRARAGAGTSDPGVPSRAARRSRAKPRLAASRRRAEPMSGPVRLWYATVYVRDFARALAFYRDVLGLPLRFADEKFGFASFATPGAGFTIARIDDGDPEQRALVGRHTGIAFGVDDLQKTYEAWRARGVAFPLPPTQQPWGGTLAQLADPEGNLLTLDRYREEE